MASTDIHFLRPWLKCVFHFAEFHETPNPVNVCVHHRKQFHKNQQLVPNIGNIWSNSISKERLLSTQFKRNPRIIELCAADLLWWFSWNSAIKYGKDGLNFMYDITQHYITLHEYWWVNFKKTQILFHYFSKLSAPNFMNIRKMIQMDGWIDR